MTCLADLSTVTQDEFFVSMSAAGAVPRAAALNATLAASICAALPAATNATTLDELRLELALMPDALNIVFEVAVANATGCDAPSYLVPLLTAALAQQANAVDAHTARSLAFVLAASPDPQVLRSAVLPLATTDAATSASQVSY